MAKLTTLEEKLAEVTDPRLRRRASVWWLRQCAVSKCSLALLFQCRRLLPAQERHRLKQAE